MQIREEVVGTLFPMHSSHPRTRRCSSRGSRSKTAGRCPYEHESTRPEPVAIAMAGATAGSLTSEPAQTVSTGQYADVRVAEEQKNIGRNDPCWCGSGKKYKKCHGQ